MAPDERNEMTEIADYQTLLERASEIRPGDYLDRIEPNRDIRGVRNGRYRYDGLRVAGKVERVAWIYRDAVANLVEEVLPSDGWRPANVSGFRIYVRNIFDESQPRVFTLPGNLADLTGAVVRRQEVQP